MPSSQPYVTPYTNQNVAQVLLLYLGREGVSKIFGVPGGGLANLLVELKNQRQTFDYIVCRHETGAAYIADGYYRATGTLGVVMVTSGPGATNALTGAMTAQNDGSAVLVISGEVNEQYFGKGYLQEGLDADLDVHAIYKAAACYSAELTDESEVQTLIEQALRDALSIPRGMAHLSVPNNVSIEIVTTPQPAPNPPSPTIEIPNSPANYRTMPAGVDHGSVLQAAEQFLACKRPLIFLGSGCRDALRDTSTLDKLVIFAERYAIPVMTTPDGKGVFPEGHSLSLRVHGFASNTWGPMWMQQQPTPYDGLLVLGTSLRGLSSNNWNPMLVPANSGPFIQVDLDQQAIARSFPVTQGIVGDVGAFIRELADRDVHAGPEIRTGPAERRPRVAVERAFFPDHFRGNDGLRRVRRQDCPHRSDSTAATQRHTRVLCDIDCPSGLDGAVPDVGVGPPAGTDDRDDCAVREHDRGKHSGEPGVVGGKRSDYPEQPGALCAGSRYARQRPALAARRGVRQRNKFRDSGAEPNAGSGFPLPRFRGGQASRE